MNFKTWLESRGCEVEVVQEEDGNGYYVMMVNTPEGTRHEVTETLS